MRTVFVLIVVLVVLFLLAAVLTTDRPVLAEAPADVADVALPTGPVRAQDVAGVRFSLAARGYRMSEVDLVLERLAEELADRDRRIALLEATVEGGQPVEPAQVVEAGPGDLPLTQTPLAQTPAADR